MSGSDHWNAVYQSKASDAVSWFQPEATLSLALIDTLRVPQSAAVLDVGAGASKLVDGLLARGYRDITLLDLAERGLAVTRKRLSEAPVKYEVADITRWQPSRLYSIWHDRAVFHFLTSESERSAYRDTLVRAVRPGGYVIIATFAADGPERCSGLPVQRYSEEALVSAFAKTLKPLEIRFERHRTPAGAEQSFVYALFERM